MTIRAKDQQAMDVQHEITMIAGDASEGIGVTEDGRAVELHRGEAIRKQVGDVWDDGAGRGYEVVQNSDETTWRCVAETCAYCKRAIPAEDSEEVPEVDDDEAWERLAKHHEADCEWILTRAHRVND